MTGCPVASTSPETDAPAGRSQVQRLLCGFPGGVLDGQLRALEVRKRQDHQVRPGHLQRLLRHELEYLVNRSAAEQPAGHFRAGPQPPFLPVGRVEQPGVLDRHPSSCGKRGDQGLVLLVERRAVPLLRQVEVAIDLITDPDGHAQEGPHRRMPVREPGGLGVAGDLGEPQRVGVFDQQPEQPTPLWPVVNSGDGPLIHPDRDEVRQPAVFADHAERAVAGVHQRDRGLHDPPEHGLELQVAADRDNGLQQAVHPVPRVHDGLQTSLQLGQQVIETQLRQYQVRLCRLHRASLLLVWAIRELIVWQRVHRAYARLLPLPGPTGRLTGQAVRPDSYRKRAP